MVPPPVEGVVVVHTKHLRADPVEPGDGTRILISRYYPRGLGGKANETWAEWRKELGPSRELHAAFKEGAVSWETFTRRFLAEMEDEAAGAALHDLAARSRGGETLTFLCDHPRGLPPERCHRFLVQGLLAARAGAGGTPPRP